MKLSDGERASPERVERGGGGRGWGAGRQRAEMAEPAEEVGVSDEKGGVQFTSF